MNTPKDMIYEINENQRKLERSGKLGCTVRLLETVESLEKKVSQLEEENKNLKKDILRLFHCY